MYEQRNRRLFLDSGGKKMANFAVNANDEVITKGRELLERLARPGEKQGDVLGRIFDIVEQQEEGETMRQSGIDVQALDSSLANIRTMFLATVTGKEQIITVFSQ